MFNHTIVCLFDIFFLLAIAMFVFRITAFDAFRYFILFSCIYVKIAVDTLRRSFIYLCWRTTILKLTNLKVLSKLALYIYIQNYPKNQVYNLLV